MWVLFCSLDALEVFGLVRGALAVLRFLRKITMKHTKPRLKVDTREQKTKTDCTGKLTEWNKERFESIVEECLPFGDYWAEVQKEDGTWCEVPVVFERKSLGDLFGTLSKGYERFKREIQRAKDVGVHLILVIEGSLTEVNAGFEYSQRSGSEVVQQLSTLRVKYDLEVMFFNSRREMCRWIEEVFDAIARNYSKQPNSGRVEG